MLTDQKIFYAVEIFLLLICVISHVHASVRSGKSRSSVQNDETFNEHSSNQISADDKSKSEEEQLYYLPMQTVFGVTEILTAAGSLLTTSPPHLTINPAPIQTTYHQSTSTFNEDSSKPDNFYNGPFHSQCVSETPVNDLESHLLVPSRDLLKESVIMSGHLEIASKTSSDEEVSAVNNFVSQPSIALQGTILHSHTITDV